MNKCIAFICLLSLGLSAQAADLDHVMVAEGYVRGLPPSATNTAAYMRIHNHGETPVVLVGARTPAAFFSELHTTQMENGSMVMRHLPTLRIAAGDSAVLESGGMHLMLMGLRAALSEGDNVELTLEFEGGLEKTVSLPVRSVLNEPATQGGGQHDHH